MSRVGKIETAQIVKYKGCIGTVNYSKEKDYFFGKINAIRARITYKAKTIEGLKREFMDAVDMYCYSTRARDTKNL